MFGYDRDLPRQNGNRFAALIQAGDYSAAEAMFNEPEVGIASRPSAFSNWRVERRGQTPREWLRGRYPLTVTASFGRDQRYSLAVEATASGMRRADRWTFYTP